MTDRKTVIANEKARQADFEARKSALLDEFNSIAEPVLEFRRIESQMEKIQEQLQQMSHAQGNARRNFQRDLKLAIPDELAVAMKDARTQLGRTKRQPRSSNEFNRLGKLTDWLAEAESAIGDANVDTGKLELMAKRGQALLEPEMVA